MLGQRQKLQTHSVDTGNIDYRYNVHHLSLEPLDCRVPSLPTLT